MSVDPFGGKGAKTLSGWHDLTAAIATRLPTRLLQTRHIARNVNRTIAAKRPRK